MDAEEIALVESLIERMVAGESRINQAKPVPYWYPLSLATFGKSEILEALKTMCSFRTSMAERTKVFEGNFARWQGAGEAVMVNSGSSADLLLCLLMSNPLRPMLPSQSELIMPVVTWPTQIWSALMAGFKVKLVDVDPVTLNIDLDDLERNVSSATRGIFLVHVMGNPCDMDAVARVAQKHDLVVLEDCCEAMGASWAGQKVGNFGIGGTFSFFFSHHITCMEGGMVVTRDAETADHLRLLRAHGWVRNVDSSKFGLADFPDIDPRYAFVNWGLNVRPTEVQAAFGIRQLEKADAFASRRAAMATRFRAFVAGTEHLSAPTVHPEATPAWLALPIMVAEDAPFGRNELMKFLEVKGIETRPMICGNLARHPVANVFPEFRARVFPGADQVHSRGFYIGLSPMQSDENVERMIDTFRVFLRKFGAP